MKKKMKIVRATGERMLHERIEELPVPLSNSEILARATTLVRLRDEERKVDAEFETHKHAHKKASTHISEERERLEQAIREKKEPRPVKFQAWARYDAGHLEEVRADTGEVLNQRALMAAEMQEDLPLGDENTDG